MNFRKLPMHSTVMLFSCETIGGNIANELQVRTERVNQQIYIMLYTLFEQRLKTVHHGFSPLAIMFQAEVWLLEIVEMNAHQLPVALPVAEFTSDGSFHVVTRVHVVTFWCTFPPDPGI